MNFLSLFYFNLKWIFPFTVHYIPLTIFLENNYSDKEICKTKGLCEMRCDAWETNISVKSGPRVVMLLQT